jgi:hypothetical protein
MRVLTIIILFFLTNLELTAQKDQELIYSDVVMIDGSSSSDLFKRGKIWFVESFVNSNNVIHLENENDNIIIGKGQFPYNPKIFNASARTVGIINYSIKLYFKDGRYKFELTNFTHESRSVSNYGGIDFGLITSGSNCPNPKKGMGANWSDKVWTDIKEQIDCEVNQIIVSLKNGMQKQVQSNSNDW